MLTRLADQRPTSGWSWPRIVENNDILYLYAEKNYRRKINICWYDFEGIFIANGEVGIIGSRRKPYRKSPRAQIKGALTECKR
jgi:hypothetical protein